MKLPEVCKRWFPVSLAGTALTILAGTSIPSAEGNPSPPPTISTVAATLDDETDETATTTTYTKYTYTKVTDIASLTEGSTIVFVYESGAVGMSYQNTTSTNYRYGVSLSSLDTSTGTLTLKDSEVASADQTGSSYVYPMTVSLQTESSTTDDDTTDDTTEEETTTTYYTFYDEVTGGYLNWASGNSLRTGSYDSYADYIPATVTISDGDAIVYFGTSNTTNYLQYNSTSPRFACYSSTQKTVQIYLLTSTETVTEEVSDEGTGDEDDDSDETTYTYTKVTSEDDLAAGDVVLIVNESYGVALSKDNGNNRKTASVTIDESTITLASSAIASSSSDEENVYELTLKSSDDDTYPWMFYDPLNDGYLYASSSSSNYMKTISSSSSSLTSTAYATIEISDGDAVITFNQTNRNTVRYNYTSTIFSCYTSTSQNAVQLYKKVVEASEDGTDDEISTTTLYTFTKATSSDDLAADKTIIFVSTDYAVAMGYNNSSNRKAASTALNIQEDEEGNSFVQLYGSQIATFSKDSTNVYTFTLGGETDAWTFYDTVNAAYLYASTSASSGALRTNSSSTYADYRAATIAFTSDDESDETDVTTTITFNSTAITYNTLLYNSNSGSTLFNCYASTNTTQKPVDIYVLTATDELEAGTFTISDIGYATLYLTSAFVMPEGVEGAIVSGLSAEEENTLTLEYNYTAGSTVPASTGLLLKGDAGTYTYGLLTTSTASAPEDNLLHGELDDENMTAYTEDGVDFYYYKLTYADETKDADSFGFYWGADNGAAFAMTGTNHAYLALSQSETSASAAAMGFSLNGGTTQTSIGSVIADTDEASSESNGLNVYDLQGRKLRVSSLNALPAGLYIVNGQKKLVK